MLTIQPNEANGTILNDSFRMAPIQSFGMALSVGDFNGDGLDDVAILMEASTTTRSIELFLAPFDREAGFSTKRHRTMYVDGPGIFLGLPSAKMADVNGDGKADLAVYRYDTNSTISQIHIVFGEAGLPDPQDLDQGNASLKISGIPGDRFGEKMAAGDFDGDGVGDFAILSSSETTSLIYFVKGGESLSVGTVNLSIENPFVRLTVDGEGDSLVTGDFDGDHKDDLAIGALRTFVKEVAVFFGRSPFPTAGGAHLTTDVQIIGKYSGFGGGHRDIGPVSAGDITGDHRDDLVIQGISFENPQWVLSGSDISSGQPALRQETGFPESVVFYPIPAEASTTEWTSIFADFDGDGAKDLFSFYSLDIGGSLTTDVSPGGISLGNLGYSSLGWIGDFFLFGVGDFNGDGFQDLVCYENFNSIYAPYGAVRLLFGFRPLKNPRMVVLSGPGDSLSTTVSLGVDGNPTEMFVSGDITNDFKNKWVPYTTSLDVGLTPEGLTKTIHVRFRNAVGRESETVSTSVSIQVATPQIVTDTNRLRPGGTATFECHVLNTGSLRARIFGPHGEDVRELENRGVEQGIYTIAWNGTNNFGTPVARGVYFLIIDANGGTTKKEILVE